MRTGWKRGQCLESVFVYGYDLQRRIPNVLVATLGTLKMVDRAMTFGDSFRVKSRFLELAIHVRGKYKIAKGLAFPDFKKL